MFVSFTDWEFDGNVDNAVEAAKGFWPEMNCLLYTSPSPRD